MRSGGFSNISALSQGECSWDIQPDLTFFLFFLRTFHVTSIYLFIFGLVSGILVPLPGVELTSPAVGCEFLLSPNPLNHKGSPLIFLTHHPVLSLLPQLSLDNKDSCRFSSGYVWM